MKHIFTISLCFLALSLSAQYTLTVEANTPVAAAGTTYRFYVNVTDATDRVMGVIGDNETPLEVYTPNGAFNSVYNQSWSASGINSAYFPYFPDMADDTYATIGLDGPANSSGIDGAGIVYLAEDSSQPISPYFTTHGSTTLIANTIVGSMYYSLGTNGLPDANMRVLILQVTTTGCISGVLNYLIWPLGLGADWFKITMPFNGAGTFVGEEVQGLACGCTISIACNYNPEAIIDDGSCEFLCNGCTDTEACNYDPSANVDDSSCEYLSCAGCVDDTACNHNPFSTIDDGSCEYISCSGCMNPSACNYDSTATLNDGSCEYISCSGCMNPSACNYDSTATINTSCEFISCYGCTNEFACNYDPESTLNDGSCEFESCTGCQYEFACNYNPEATIADNDSCDFGTCPGCTDSTACNYNPTVFEDDGSCEYCSCSSGFPEGFCDCNGNTLDECGVCNGPGAVYECGCADIPDGDCDCNGNTLDECGACGGSGVPAGDCDCDGNVLDAIGVCGGYCQSDENNNGICDIDELNPDTVCGEGTSWDSELGQCVVTYPSDSNFDGCVDLNDLMDLLSDYGICLDPE